MSMLDQYDYHLPPELIATEPASPRDSSRLFVYETKTNTITIDTFRNLAEYIPAHSCMVFNDTKVVPARLHLAKPTGGKIEVFLLLNELRPGETVIRGIVDRRAEVGWHLSFPGGETLEVIEQEEQFFFFRPSVSMERLWALIDTHGETPVPKYIKGSSLSEDRLREKYQSIFAKHPASVAAPTASLHFTEHVLGHLKRKGCTEAKVTLHVGPGTFAPVEESSFATKKLHVEYGAIDNAAAERINAAKKKGEAIVTVGTTATRVVEAFSVKDDGVSPQEGPIDIFIFPPYTFKVPDILLTNFHLPKSSLMLLVDAFLKHKNAKKGILELYQRAAKEKFRFYSFGDAMLIL
jgi:S-adenosylmethionine:tRNA ribosyltransferase-isomerase